MGTPAFPGRTRGRVVIVHTKDDLAKVRAGDIVVSIMTNATYAPVLARAGAIVTDEGGITCHAAILSRELRIPCVVGAAHATQILNDGTEVEVDAEKGVVRILQRSS